jgi:hypothetical protein
MSKTRHLALGSPSTPSVLTELADAAFYRLAQGSYQEDLIDGRARWSGSELKGQAKKWGANYQRSRLALLRRLQSHARAHDAECAGIRLARTKGVRVVLAWRLAQSATWYFVDAS